MKHNIIKTDNYLLVVDDSEIKVNDFMYFWNGQSGSIHKHKEGYVTENIYGAGVKIIAHLPLNNSPILEGVPLLPPLEVEDDVDFICEEEAKKFHDKSKHRDDDMYNQLVHEDKLMIKIGYNKAKEKYKFTEEDIAKAVMFGRWGETTKKAYQDFIQSLSQPKTPTHFEFEMEDKVALDGHTVIGKEIKTTTNSQGQTQVVGRYSYE